MCARPLGGAVKLIRDLKEVSEPVAGVTWESFTAAAADFQVLLQLKSTEPFGF